jgi:hypothetical protein
MIENSTDENSTILAPPDDMINRYIPSIAKRYVYTAKREPDINSSYMVLPPCDYRLLNKCRHDYELSKRFYKHLDIEDLNKILNESSVEYVLLSKKTDDEINNTIITKISLIAESELYSLYEIK